MNNRKSTDPTLEKLFNRPGYLFRRCSQSAGGFFEQACRDLGLTTGQYDVLFVLAQEASVDQDRLALLLGQDRSTTGVLAANLERKGLISREVKPADRRKRILTLTREGAKILKKAEPKAEQAKDLVLSSLNIKEKKQLFRLLQRIVTNSSLHTP